MVRVHTTHPYLIPLLIQCLHQNTLHKSIFLAFLIQQFRIVHSYIYIPLSKQWTDSITKVFSCDVLLIISILHNIKT